MSARNGILCAGTIVVDVGKVIDRYPPPERLALIDSMSLSTGGPAVNLARDLVRLGAPFPLAVAGVVGDDPHADFLLGELAGDGIDVSGIRRSADAATSFTDAMVVRDGGSRTFFHHIGANALIGPEDVALATSIARIVHLGSPGLHPRLDAPLDGDDGGSPANGWVAILTEARRLGLRTNMELVTLDPAVQRRLVLPCLPLLDTLVINELEACALAGIDPATLGTIGGADEPDWPELEAVAGRLIELGVGTVAAVHFPGGCVAASATGGLTRHGSVRLPREQIVSSVGAGDAFASGVVFGVHEGWPVEDCLRAGVCAAAASLRSAGTSDGVLPLADCLALGEEFGYR